MSFLSQNKYFIQSKLFIDMKGLPLNQKLIKYELIKCEIRERLKKSYHSSIDKDMFYKEAFSVLADYEYDYLLQNLFLENKFTLIVNLLKKNNLIDNRIDAIKDRLLRSLTTFCMTKDQLIESEFDDFIKQSFIERIVIWNKNNPNPYIHGYIDYIINKFNYEENQGALELHIIFTKIWNSSREFNNENLILKTQIFYGLISKELNLNPMLYAEKKLDTFKQMLEDYYNELFVNIKFIPLIKIDDINLNTICSIQIDKYNKVITKIRTLNSYSEANKYSDLLFMLATSDVSEYDYFRKIISNKIEKCQYPSASELEEIFKISSEYKSISFILENIYAYEQL